MTMLRASTNSPKPDEEGVQVKHKCFNGTIYKKQTIVITAATIKQVHQHVTSLLKREEQ